MKAFKFLLPAAAFFLIILYNAFPDEYDQISLLEVGEEPEYLYYDSPTETMNVFCKGSDKNFNGVFEPDSGDTYPTWWIIKKNGDNFEGKYMAFFDFNSFALPLRPYVDNDGSTPVIFIPQGMAVISYDMRTMEKKGEMDFGYSVKAVAGDSSYMYFSVEEEFGKPGKVILYDKHAGIFTDTIDAGIGVQQIIPYTTDSGKKGFAILNEGNYGSDNSSVIFAEFETSGKITKTLLETGDLANHLDLDGHRLAITVNGSHKVMIIDINTKTVLKEINTGTNGWDGPRETLLRGSRIFTSTYSDKMIQDQWVNNFFIQYLPAGGKTEGMAFFGNDYLMAANISNNDYSGSKYVIIYKKNTSIPSDRFDLTVGKAPVAAFFDNSQKLFHVFCEGADIDHDGAYDPDDGDAKPSWWLIKPLPDKYAIKMAYEFDFNSLKVPFRPFVDFKDGKIYINHPGRISSYDLNTQELINKDFIDADASAVSGDSSYLYVSVPDKNGAKGRVMVYNRESLTEVQEIGAGINVSQTLPYTYPQTDTGLAILNEGTSGAANSTLQFGPLDNINDLTEFQAGDSGTHLINRNDMLAATIYGSHKVQLYSLGEEILLREINTGTLGSNGPREAMFVEQPGIVSLLVSTYYGDIRLFDISSGNQIVYSNTHGKAEGMSYGVIDYTGFLAVANRFNKDGTADSIVTVFELSVMTDVKKDIKEPNKLTIYPNPASDHINFKYDSGRGELIYSVEITNLTGNEICRLDYNRHHNPGEFSIPIKNKGLAGGTYFLIIRTSERVLSSPFIITAD